MIFTPPGSKSPKKQASNSSVFLSRRLRSLKVAGAILLTVPPLYAQTGTPEPILLWPENPPNALESAGPEQFDEKRGNYSHVAIPSIVVFPADPGTSNGMAFVVCSGGGYGSHDWRNHVINMASHLNKQGITIIGLKYRTRPPYDTKEIQAITLADGKRAIRTVRSRAAEWGIDPDKIGIIGYSAGANLAMNVAANFDRGNPGSSDPIERISSRPDFAVGCATWHWREKKNPFTFQKDSPPVFLVHATNDGIGGGAPIELPQEIRAQLEELGVPVNMQTFDVGAHGVGNLIPARIAAGFPPTKWPELLLGWLEAGTPAGASKEHVSQTDAPSPAADASSGSN